MSATLISAAGAAPESKIAAVPLAALPAQSTGGVVLLQTGTTNQVTYDATGDGVADQTQTLGNVTKSCSLSTDNSILKIDGINSKGSGQAGLLSGSIGVIDVQTDRSGTESSGKSCGLVDAPSQSLVLGVGGPAFAAAHPVFASALLDVELKGNAQIQAIAYRGTTAVGLYELRSGRTVATPVATTPPTGYTGPANVVFTCLANKADSAPDAGVASNCRWPISSPSWADTNNDGVNDSTGDDGVYFDKLVLQPVNGSFSLEGGADGVVAGSPTAASGLPQTASFFEVPGPLTNCGDPALTISGTGTTPSATVKRIDNADGPGTCQPLAITLTNGDNTLTIQKSITAQTTAQFIVTVTWSFLVPPGGTFNPGFHHTQIDWLQNGQFEEVPFCTYGNLDPQTGVLTGVTPAITSAQDRVTSIPGTQYACWATQTASGDATTGLLNIKEQIYLLGDPMMRG